MNNISTSGLKAIVLATVFYREFKVISSELFPQVQLEKGARATDDAKMELSAPNEMTYVYVLIRMVKSLV